MPQAATLLPPKSSSLSRLHALVENDLAQVNALILEHIQTGIPLIGEVAKHILAAGGKRLRPSLTLACAKLCGYEGTRHIELAACIEFIHTATLLHDDVVDESKLRRGVPTANAVWGNQASVLVGDYLYTRSFQLMVTDGSLEVLRILSDATTTISQGEVLQLMIGGNPESSREDYMEVISSKTAALFAAACEIGGVLGENPEHQQALQQFGQNIGMAFQLTDDALDYTAEQEAFGKEVGDDFREGKITLPVLHAYQTGNAEEQEFWRKALGEHSRDREDLARAITLIEKHGGISETLALARNYCGKARENLAPFPASREKDALLDTVDFCLERTY